MKQRVAAVVVGLMLVGGVSAFAVASQAAAMSIAGRWDVVCSFAEGTMDGSVTIAETGGKLTGTATTPHGVLPITGEVTGTTVTFSFTVDHPDGAMNVVFNGTRQDDGTLSGKASSPMGDISWTAARAKGDHAPTAATMIHAHVRDVHMWMMHTLHIQKLHGQ